jgi:hypothetical protein
MLRLMMPPLLTILAAAAAADPAAAADICYCRHFPHLLPAIDTAAALRMLLACQ